MLILQSHLSPSITFSRKNCVHTKKKMAIVKYLESTHSLENGFVTKEPVSRSTKVMHHVQEFNASHLTSSKASIFIGVVIIKRSHRSIRNKV
jgi:hypothetical protein